MDLDEALIIEHFSKLHQQYKEFECLKCSDNFDNVHAIREHMAAAHPTNYLFVGARISSHSDDESDDI